MADTKQHDENLIDSITDASEIYVEKEVASVWTAFKATMLQLVSYLSSYFMTYLIYDQKAMQCQLMAEEQSVAYDTASLPSASSYPIGQTVLLVAGASALPTFWGGLLTTRAIRLRSVYNNKTASIEWSTKVEILLKFDTDYIWANGRFNLTSGALTGSMKHRMYLEEDHFGDYSFYNMESDWVSNLISLVSKESDGICRIEFLNTDYCAQLVYTTCSAPIAPSSEPYVFNMVNTGSIILLYQYDTIDGHTQSQVKAIVEIEFPLVKISP